LPQQRQEALEMDMKHIGHIVHAASHEEQHPKLAGVVLIIIGLFFTPWLIGIPILIYGFYKLLK
jgi:hypothetical protein